jgi:hypothetical protein
MERKGNWHIASRRPKSDFHLRPGDHLGRDTLLTGDRAAVSIVGLYRRFRCITGGIAA